MLKPCENMKINALTVSHIARSFAVTVLCLLAVLCGNANAADYGWTSAGLSTYSTPEGVCEVLTAAQPGWTLLATRLVSGYSYACDGYNPSWNQYSTLGSAIRTGDGCTAPAVVNAQGGCDTPIVPESCGAYPTKEIAANNSWANVKNCSCTWNNALHGSMNCDCSNAVTNRPVNIDIECRATGGLTNEGAVAGPVPNPAPPAEVAYPECPVGSYKYTDIDGHSECTTPVPPEISPPPCTSGNAGTINGKLVCLPANPAPATAAAAADSALAKAAAAKAASGTATAVQAAKDAAIEAQRAKDAADSLPSSTATQNSLLKAIEAAKQAAGYAGQPYGGPAASGTTTGGGSGGTGSTEGAKECGSPGRPKCQIDETGTPTGIGTSLDASKTALQTAIDGIKTAANEAVSGIGKDTSIGWLPVLPEGTCQEVQFPSITPGGAATTSDVCKWTPYVTVGFELLWAAFFAFAVLAMVAAATSKSHS